MTQWLAVRTGNPGTRSTVSGCLTMMGDRHAPKPEIRTMSEQPTLYISPVGRVTAMCVSAYGTDLAQANS